MANKELVPIASSEDEGGLELGQIVAALRRRILLIAGITTFVACGAALKALIDTPVYEANFEILTESVTLETRIVSTLDPATLSDQENEGTASVDETKLRILKSPRVLEPIVQELNAQHPEITYERLFNQLAVEPTTEDILLVSYTDQDPALVQKTINEVANAYIEFSLQDRQRDIQRGIAFLDEQLPQLRGRVDSLQSDLEALRQNNNLIDPLTEGEQLSSQISGLQQERTNLNVQLDEAQQLYANLQQELEQNGASAASTVLVENSRYQDLLNQVLTIDSQIAQESALLREASPEIQTLRAQRQNLIPLVQQEGQRLTQLLASQIRELSFRGQAVDEAIESLNVRVQQLSSVARQYSDIQRELDIAIANLSEFLTQREALRIEIAQRQAPWELLTQPEEPRISGASAKRNLVLGTALGLLLGIGTALTIDKFSSFVRTPKEIEEITRLPLLGIIPLNHFLHTETSSSESTEQWLQETLPALDTVDEPGNSYVSIPFTESFRSLYTNIRLSNPDNPIKSLAISSATPNEGKSTIAIHLAKAAAAMNRKVLIVDTDLRRPTIHKGLNLENQRGLVDVVSMNLTLSEAVQAFRTNANLFVLPSGSIPPDPTTVLASKAMQSLHEDVQQEYDLVIYDTPPVVGFADASLVANCAQGLLLIVGLEKVKRGNLTQAIDNLRLSGLPVLGTVANMAEEKNTTYYNYYQYPQKQQKEFTHSESWSLSRIRDDLGDVMSNLLSRRR